MTQATEQPPSSGSSASPPSSSSSTPQRRVGLLLLAGLYVALAVPLLSRSTDMGPPPEAPLPGAPWLLQQIVGTGAALLVVQAALYLAGVLLVARAAARQLPLRGPRLLTVGLLLLLGLSPELLAWCRGRGPESLSLSLFLLLVAQALPRLAGMLRDGPAAPPPSFSLSKSLSTSGQIEASQRGGSLGPADPAAVASSVEISLPELAALAESTQSAASSLGSPGSPGSAPPRRTSPSSRPRGGRRPPPRPDDPLAPPLLRNSRRGLFALTALAWAFCGAAHAPWLLSVAILGWPLVLVGGGSEDARRARKVVVPLIGVALALWAGSAVHGIVSGRADRAHLMLLAQRLLPERAQDRAGPAAQALAALPDAPELSCLAGRWPSQCPPLSQPLRAWLRGPGQSAYLRSRLAAPGQALVAPLLRANAMLFGRGPEIQDPLLGAVSAPPDAALEDLIVESLGGAQPPTWQSAIGARMTRYGRGALFTLLVALALLSYAAIAGRVDRRFVLPLTLLLSIGPALCCCFHQDAADLQRRALPLLLCLRVAVIFLLGLGLSVAAGERR